MTSKNIIKILLTNLIVLGCFFLVLRSIDNNEYTKENRVSFYFYEDFDAANNELNFLYNFSINIQSTFESNCAEMYFSYFAEKIRDNYSEYTRYLLEDRKSFQMLKNENINLFPLSSSQTEAYCRQEFGKIQSVFNGINIDSFNTSLGQRTIQKINQNLKREIIEGVIDHKSYDDFSGIRIIVSTENEESLRKQVDEILKIESAKIVNSIKLITFSKFNIALKEQVNFGDLLGKDYFDEFENFYNQSNFIGVVSKNLINPFNENRHNNVIKSSIAILILLLFFINYILFKYFKNKKIFLNNLIKFFN